MRVNRRIGVLSFVLFTVGMLLGATPDVPEKLRPPEGQVLLMHLRGTGKQIYACQKAGDVFAWKLKGPDAKLTDESGQPAGRHFAGPTWESSDGSQVAGKLAASVASPDADSIAWLLVNAVSHRGEGRMAKVQNIQRLETKGGVAPAAGCGAGTENRETSVPYEAGYYFYGQPDSK